MWLQGGAFLERVPLQICKESHVLRLWLVWGCFLYKSFEKSSFVSWSWLGSFFHKSFKKGCWFEAFSFTNPLGDAQLPLLWGFQRHLLVDSLINRWSWFEYLIDWLIYQSIVQLVNEPTRLEQVSNEIRLINRLTIFYYLINW